MLELLIFIATHDNLLIFIWYDDSTMNSRMLRDFF